MYTYEQASAYMAEYIRERRKKWILENGPCQECGSTQNLQVDHIDKTTKKYHVGRVWTLNEGTRLEELAKCQVLCETCHRKKTRRENTKIAHGTLNTYQRHSCRCEICKDFYRKYRRSIYERIGR